MNPNLKILLVDDAPDFIEILKRILIKQAYNVFTASCGEEAIQMIKSQDLDVVITDMMMNGLSGLDILEYIQSEQLEVYSIVITAYGSVENAVDAMKKGAFSYFIKSNDPQELIFELEKIKKLKHLSKENARLKSNTFVQDYVLETKNAKFQSVIKYAEKVAQTDANVLILGESGVGKEIIARYIHDYSSRKQEVFMAVNCFSFSDSMLEAELYGHEKGAFTGSTQTRIGRFEASHLGTLFLDEVADIPLSAQTKILRNIERKEIERIGSNKTIQVDFRLIAATNKSLKAEMAMRNFREDLYYRMSTVVLEIPPLRERKEDLPILVAYFLTRARRELKKNVIQVDEPLMAILTYIPEIYNEGGSTPNA
ncbi:sigma-54 dependent transcriptional regulator [Fusibacter sp. 3D3]|uniref:sigma-54-dependent transcriptional regulator n=1 Tax=Fusibacter sp. 3D3 TaxID=1048380 RepID=UPI0008556F52|nr:sigma-54 dependent transcriptional regulator [Fusibacter sp. 3D3]GAU76603.1 response regulator of zinc sigma-54-dependent two-component system [Fusibacter sp. 3D3]